MQGIIAVQRATFVESGNGDREGLLHWPGLVSLSTPRLGEVGGRGPSHIVTTTLRPEQRGWKAMVCPVGFHHHQVAQWSGNSQTALHQTMKETQITVCRTLQPMALDQEERSQLGPKMLGHATRCDLPAVGLPRRGCLVIQRPKHLMTLSYTIEDMSLKSAGGRKHPLTSTGGRHFN